MTLTNEQRFLLRLMRYSLQGKKLTNLPDESLDWKALVREGCDHSVPILMYDVLSEMEQQLPVEIYQKCVQLARRFTARNMRVEHAQNELVQVLSQEKIPYVILKGSASAAYYPAPELRIQGDVDFLAPQEAFDRLAERMTALGYEYRCEPGEHHRIFFKSAMCMEMHIEVGGMPEGKHREITENFLTGVYEKSQIADYGMGEYVIPGQAHHGMILILHMQRHLLSKGMGLRHIMDWACFVNRTAGEAFWQAELLPVLKQIGLFRFAAVMTKMSALYLETSCPQWAQDVPEKLCAELMEDIMSSGNFGRKDAERARAVNMIPDFKTTGKEQGKVRLLYKTLRNSVVKQHPELEHKPFSRFCRMIEKAGKYLILCCQGKRPNLLKVAAHADMRRSVYEQLCLFESEES